MRAGRSRSGGGWERLGALACLAGPLLGCGVDGVDPSSLELAAATRTRGFAVTNFSFEQPAGAPSLCPQGFNLDEREFLAAGMTPAELAAAALPEGFDYLRMVRAREGPDPCDEPTAFPDPDHLIVEGPGVVAGFDLDGVISTRAQPGLAACPHQDFAGAAGEPGIDNALWRVLGCIEGYQRGGTIDEYAIENIKSGARTILIEVSDLDDPRNDDDVGLAIHSSADPIPASATGKLLAHGSLGAMEGSRYRTFARGALVDGVLRAGPMDLRLDFNGQFLDAELHLRDARIELEFSPEGGLRGLLGGYWDIEGFYEVYARQATRAGAFTVGFRCPGIYGALQRVADRYPDPESGACTAVSTAFRIHAIPAFVVEPARSTAHASAAAADGS